MTSASGGRAATIVAVDVFEVAVPLSELARGKMSESDNGLGMALAAEEPWEVADFCYVRLVDADGVEGWGEAYVWLPESGVSQKGIGLAITEHLGRYVLGARPTDVDALNARFDRNVARNEIAKGLLDLACYDLAARQLGRPVHDLIGGAAVDRVPLCGLIPLGTPEGVADIAGFYQHLGYNSVRIKLGTGPEADRDVIAAVRERCGHDLRIRVDYNQAYSGQRAVRALSLVEPFGIDAAEQVLPVAHLLETVELQKRTSIPLFPHEGFFNLADAVALIEAGGMRVMGINAERPGGMSAALRAIDYASARGLGTIIHNQPLGLGTAAHVHLAAARWDRLGHAPEIAGDVMFDEHLVTQRCEIVNGEMLVPTGPGYGVEIDRDALENHLISAPASITL